MTNVNGLMYTVGLDLAAKGADKTVFILIKVIDESLIIENCYVINNDKN